MVDELEKIQSTLEGCIVRLDAQKHRDDDLERRIERIEARHRAESNVTKISPDGIVDRVITDDRSLASALEGSLFLAELRGIRKALEKSNAHERGY